MWKALSPGHFCWQSFQNQKAHTDFLEDIYAWSRVNFFFLDKRHAYVYKAKDNTGFVSRKPIKARVIWGKATCVQGYSSMICAKF